jgi:hypothetical protein
VGGGGGERCKALIVEVPEYWYFLLKKYLIPPLIWRDY